METAFAAQPIGRPILGTPETIEAFDAGAIRAFLAREYAPGRMVLVGRGRCGTRPGRGGRASASSARAAPSPAPALPAGRYTGGERRMPRRLEQANLVLGLPGLSFKDPAYFADPPLRPRARRRPDLPALARGAREPRPRLLDRLVPLAVLRLRPVRHRRRHIRRGCRRLVEVTARQRAPGGARPRGGRNSPAPGPR